MKSYLLLFLSLFISLNAADTADKQFTSLSEPVKEVIGHYLHNIEKLEKEALQARAKGIGLRMQNLVSQEQVCKDTIEMGNLIEGKLRFRLVEFFIKSDRSKLSSLNKLTLMREFIKAEQKEDRRDAILEQMYQLITKNVLEFESYRDVLKIVDQVDAVAQEKLKRKFYSISEFKQVYEKFKINITKWPISRFLYLWELMKIYEKDQPSDFLKSLWLGIEMAEELEQPISVPESFINNVKKENDVVAFQYRRFMRIGFPYNIPSDIYNLVEIVLGIKNHATFAKQQEPTVENLKKLGQEAIKTAKNAYSIDPKITRALIESEFVTT